MVEKEEEDIIDQVKKEVEKELETKRSKKGKAEVGKTQKDTSPPQLQFADITKRRYNNISNELYRQYLYSTGANITINFPLKLSIDRGNIHRIFDSSGLSYFIPPNWIGIVSKAKPGAPNFVM